MTLGELIKKSRIEHELTQEDLAEAVGTTKATVSRWESNQVYNFKRPMISRICGILASLSGHKTYSDVISSEEDTLLRAYRIADPATKAAIAKLLDMK